MCEQLLFHLNEYSVMSDQIVEGKYIFLENKGVENIRRTKIHSLRRRRKTEGEKKENIWKMKIYFFAEEKKIIGQGKWSNSAIEKP